MSHRDKLERFGMATSMFTNTVEDILPQMADIIEGKTEPLEGATKEQMAELTWRQIEKRLAEVNAVAAEIRRSTFE